VLQAFSMKSSELERRLRPWRARLGERRAGKALLEEVTAALQEGPLWDSDDAELLDGISHPALLPQPFEALAAAVCAEVESPCGISGSLGRAIRRIGGAEAVRMYDNLIERSDDSHFKFLRLQRDEILQVELRSIGQLRAAEVAERLGVPALDPAPPASREGHAPT
jgi:hypothetical protein